MSFVDELSTPILRTDEDDHGNRRIFSDDELNTRMEYGGCCCDPSSKGHRFIVLLLMCLIGFATSFCDGNSAALQNHFLKDLNMSTAQFMWADSISLWPNVVMCFLGGFLIDRVFGIRFGTILYVFILTIGQLIFAIGVVFNTYWLILLGSLVFGIGSVSLDVAQRNFAVLWFKNKELNTVFGIISLFGLSGVTINFWVMEPLYKYINQWYVEHVCLGVVMLISFTVCLMSFICALLLGVIDKRAQRILQRNDNPSGEIAKLSDVKSFKATFWILTAIGVATFTSVLPFSALSQTFYIQKYGFSVQDANFMNSLLCIIQAVATPLFGFILDKTGKNIYWMLISTVILITASSFLLFTFINPYFCSILIGLAYLMVCNTSGPLIAFTVPEYQLGIAYGTFSAVGCLILAIASMFIGSIVDHFGFFTLGIFSICWLGVALTGTLIAWIHNENKNGILNMTPYERELHLASDIDRTRLILN